VSTKGNGPDEDLPVPAPVAADPGALEAAPAPVAEAVPEAGGAEEVRPADEVEALRQECEALREALLRRRADFENYRRRVERDREAVAAEAEAGILRQVLGTVDNLERALAASASDSGLREGVELTLRELTTLLDSLGVVSIVPLGERFDPAFHQAMVHEPAPGFEPGVVAQVYRKGYVFKDRLLRPALVKVAGPGPAPEGDEETQ
jgi:molecular chaperone GrpE